MHSSEKRIWNNAHIRNPRDFWGGIAVILVASAALWATADLPGMRGGMFGPGTAPRLFAGALFILGCVVALMGLCGAPAAMERYHFRGIFFVTSATLAFAFAVRPMGLLLACFGSFIIAALGSPAQPWKSTIAVGLVLTAFCGLVFPFLLKLPFDLIPGFLLR
jgi:putative tricarboxylic transport membrane protein